MSSAEEHPYVDYVLTDKNCKLKVKSTKGQYLGFNSEEEFTCIMFRLRFEHFATPEHLANAAGDKIINEQKDYYY